MEAQKGSFSDRIGEYLESHPELNGNEHREKAVKIENVSLIKEKMIVCAKRAVQKYLNANHSFTERKPSIELENVFIAGPIPMRLKIVKRYRWTVNGEHGHVRDGQFMFHGISFTLNKDAEGGEEIAKFNLADYGDEFRLKHREVNPKYRGNGLADAGLVAVEEFIKEYVRKIPAREPILEANAAQLDVASWFSKNGFETTIDPVSLHPGEQPIQVYDFDEILTSLETENGKYEMGPHLYIFPAEFRGPKMVDGGPGTGVNFDAAARVHFRKKLSVEKSEPLIAGILHRIRAKLSGAKA